MKWLLLLLIIPLVAQGPIIGMLSSPWSPYWFSGQSTMAGSPTGPVIAVDPGEIHGHGFVSDFQRYQLALAAGWTPEEAIIATAISIAEDGSGDPAALSPANRNGTKDLGLWQINSVHWAQFGGAQALVDPLTNARAGHWLYANGGWNHWCTYPGGCGGGPGSPSWPAALARARAAVTSQPPNQT